MRIVLFCHPQFLGSQSMSRFASMLETAFAARSHTVQSWSPKPFFYTVFKATRFKKWAGYIDQYLVFPLIVRLRLMRAPRDTLFVFCDQALGPWVPLVKGRPNVVHVHDLLALRSALNDIPENPTSSSGKLYQRYIRRGFSYAQHFIAISNKTLQDLVRFGNTPVERVSVVYNGLNYPYRPLAATDAEARLKSLGLNLRYRQFLLHVGGGQWYKNTVGLIAIYADYVAKQSAGGRPVLPLIIVGPRPNAAQVEALKAVPSEGAVHYFQNVDPGVLEAAYAASNVFIFPSLAEGFGWPIIEALSCGALVLTTGEPPMNEVGGDAAIYIPRLSSLDCMSSWASECSDTLIRAVDLPSNEREAKRRLGIQWASRFDQDSAIEAYLVIYRSVLNQRGFGEPTEVDQTKEEARVR